jgi:hypothetical protein
MNVCSSLCLLLQAKTSATVKAKTPAPSERPQRCVCVCIVGFMSLHLMRYSITARRLPLYLLLVMLVLLMLRRKMRRRARLMDMCTPSRDRLQSLRLV